MSLLNNTPDGWLEAAGIQIDSIDAVEDFTEVFSSATTVITTLNATGNRHHVSVRPAEPGQGTLTLTFIRSNAKGDPGTRALAVANSFRKGIEHVIIYNNEISGMDPFPFVPTGNIERSLQIETIGRRQQAVWVVKVDYTRLGG